MFKVNPYRPGAGLMPVYIAGRDEDIQNVSQMFDALTMDIPTQSIIFSGLRGVGKTVLINKLQSIAEEKGIFCDLCICPVGRDDLWTWSLVDQLPVCLECAGCDHIAV